MATAAELVILLTARDAASKVIDGLGKSLGGLGTAGKVGAAAVTSFATAGAALLAGIGASVQVATDFEHAMSAVGAVAGASGGELDQLSQLALDLGQNVKLAGISASDAASAMEQLASGGVSTGDILKGAAEGALLLASAGGINVAQAAEIAAAALNNFGLAGDKAGHIADIFAAASNSSAVTVGDLGESMKYIGPIANSMGLSVEEVTAALAELGDQGIKGSQAGTSLRSILSSLAKPSKQASGLIKELGLEFFDAGGKMKSLGGISGELHDKLAGLTDQQRANALVTLFGNEALSAATTLYGAGADGIKKYLDQVNVEGAAAENGAKRNDNLRGSFEQLKSAIETAQIVLGRAFIPMLRTLTDQAASAVSAAIPFIQAWGPRLVSALQSGIGAVAGFGKNVAGAVGAVVDAVGKLAGGQITFAQFIGGMQIFVATVLATLGQLAQRAAPYLAAFFAAIGTFIAGAAPQILAQMGLWAASFVDWIVTTAIPFLAPRLMAFLTAVTTWITGTAIPAIGAAALGLAAALGGWVTTTAIPFLQANLPLWLAAISTWITGTALPAIGTAMLGVATAFTGWLTTTAIPYLQTNLPLWLAALSTWVTGTAIPAILTAVAGIGAAFGGWITTTAIPYLATNLPLWLAAISAWVTGTALPAIGVALVSVGTAFGDWVATTAVPWVQANLPVWLAAITGWITGTALPAVGTATAALGEALGNWITTTAIPFLQTNMPIWAATIVHWIDTTKDSIAAGLETLSNTMGDWVKDKAIPKVESQLPGWVAAITHAVDQANVAAADTGPLAEKMGNWVGEQAIPLLKAGLDNYGKEIALGMVFWPALIVVGTANLAKSIAEWAGAPAQHELAVNLTNLGNSIATWVAQMAFAVPILTFKIGQGIGEGIGKGIVAAWPAVSEAVTSRITTLVADVQTGLNNMATAATTAMGNLRNAIDAGIAGAAAAIASGVAGFPGAVLAIGGAMFSAGASIIGMLSSGIESAIGAAIQKVRDGLSQISNLLPHSEPKDPSSPLRGLTDSGRSIFEMFADGIKQGEPAAVKAAAEAASSVAKAITDSLTALKALSSFDVAKNTPTSGQFGAVVAFIANTTAMIAEIGAQFSDKALKAAGDFSDAANKVVGLIGNGVKALTELVKFVAPADASIYAFGKSLRAIVNDFAVLSEQVTQEMADEAATFAESAGKVVAIIGTGVTGFTALTTFLPPPVAAIYAFGKTLRAVINDFAVLSEQITAEMYTEAASFAEGAGKVVGMIGSGVAAFTALADYEAPATSAIYEFGKTLRAVVNDFSLLAEQITQDATDQAAKFATGAGTVVGIIGGAVDGLSKLADFVAPSQVAIDNFVYAVYETVRKIGEMAAQMSKDGIAQAGAFGVAAGSVLGALKTALDVFTGLAKLVVPSAQAIDNFGIAVAYVVQRLAVMADQIGKDGLKAAADFGAKVAAIFGALKSAIDILTSLEKFPDLAKRAMDAFFKGVQAVVARMAEATDQAGEFAKQASGYKAQILAGVADVKAAQQALNTIGGIGGTPDLHNLGQGIGTSIADGARDALDSHSPSQVMAAIGTDVVAGLVQGIGQSTPDAVKAAADAATAVAGAISAIFDALQKAGTFVLPASWSGLYAIGKGLEAAINDFAIIAERVGVDGPAAAAVLGEAGGKMAQGIGALADALTKAAAYVAPADWSGLYALDKAIERLVNDLAIVAERVGVDSATLAGQFADGAGKVAALVGTAADNLTKLGDFAAPSEAAIGNLVTAVGRLVKGIAAAAKGLTADGLTLAGQFADAGGKVVAIIGNAVSGLTSLGFFVAPAATVMDSLVAAIRYVVARFGEMAATMSDEGLTSTAALGDATQKVLGGVHEAIQTFIDLDKAVVPRTGDLSDLVVAVQGVTRNMAAAAAALGDDAIKDAAAFGAAASGIFSALKAGLDLFIQIDKPGAWPATDWLQPLVELMRGVLARGGQLLSQSQELRAIAEQFAANLGYATALFTAGINGGGLSLSGNPGAASATGNGSGVTNNYYISGNTLLSKDTSTQQMVAGIVTTQQGRQIGYSAG